MQNGCAEPDIAHLSQHILLSLSKRGWVVNEIQEAYDKGVSYPEVDLTAGAAPATRFVHSTTGKSVVLNNATGRVIHVGGTGFQY